MYREEEKSFADDVKYLKNALKGYALLQIVGEGTFVYLSNFAIDRIDDYKGEFFIVLIMLLPVLAIHNLYMFNEYISRYDYISGKNAKYGVELGKLWNSYVAIFVLSIVCRIAAIACSLVFHRQFWTFCPY